MAVISVNYSNFPCKLPMSISKSFKIGIWWSHTGNVMKAPWTDKPFVAGLVPVQRFSESELTSGPVSERSANCPRLPLWSGENSWPHWYESTVSDSGHVRACSFLDILLRRAWRTRVSAICLCLQTCLQFEIFSVSVSASVSAVFYLNSVCVCVCVCIGQKLTVCVGVCVCIVKKANVCVCVVTLSASVSVFLKFSKVTERKSLTERKSVPWYKWK